jgi:hypothetical protein
MLSDLIFFLLPLFHGMRLFLPVSPPPTVHQSQPPRAFLTQIAAEMNAAGDYA